MRKPFAFVIALTIGLLLVALWLLRYAAFVVLLFVRPVFGLVFKATAFGCLLGLVLGWVITHDDPGQHHMLWGFFVAGLASTVILFCYDAILLGLAPRRFPMLLAR